jgi:hypothetical protein
MSLFNLIFRIGADKTDFNRKMKEVPKDAKKAAKEMESALDSKAVSRASLAPPPSARACANSSVSAER